MKPIPFSLQKEFERYLNNNVIKGRSQGKYKKWLQYYLDFCHKYAFSPEHQESLPQFIRKLQKKRQTKAQQELASKAITLYYQFVKSVSLRWLRHEFSADKSYHRLNFIIEGSG